MRAESRRHLGRVGLHLRLALRYLWWVLVGSPEQRREDWRRESLRYFSLDCIRRVEAEELRKRAAREALTFERAVKDHRRKGWVSFVKEERRAAGK